ncbi:1-aminocyclopropane-1-carboxylate deaminase/D-cysteine desulfhydrase [Marinicella rhabdoformis]|uniref:1-aminocyclopropane-1-carboxylate deaminase/D-cysteine desulfhydrase n=1 Tax=Marinicella rhabdoformis TaxID=2580566 RepID=UPI0012AED498|nr:pyridoxal-phosphate dependent enzyme [Marinicella rhabdoformis]
MGMIIDKINIKGVAVCVLREDLNHHVVQGNKLRKLKYHLIEARHQSTKSIITFGGAYSNHLVATAYAARETGFKSVGVVRGEELENRPDLWSHTLHDAAKYGMDFLFVSRSDFRLKADAEKVKKLLSKIQNPYLIAEGGSGELAVKGVAELVDELVDENISPSHILCPVGTGGTLAGIILGVAKHKLPSQVIGTVVLKGLHSVKSDIIQLLGEADEKTDWCLLSNYHFGGYAKFTPELVKFSIEFEQKHRIKLDKIYNSKSFFALNDMIQKGEITAQDRPLIIHTGGLQGGTYGSEHLS